MLNSTQVSHFSLAAYSDLGRLRFFCFSVVLCLYAFVVVLNVTLVTLVCVSRNLHEPMYVFLCSLLVCELYGGAALFPLLLHHMLSDVHAVPAPMCLLQIFAVHSYGAVEYLNLAVMSYDRYVAICCPLQYKACMSRGRIALLVALTWLYPCAAMLVSLVLLHPLHLCGNVIDKVYCNMHSVTKLLCSDGGRREAVNVYGLSATFCTIFGALAVIVFTYVKILQVCCSGSRQTRQKAVSTCTPHLASLLNFSIGASFEILQSRFDMSAAPNALRVFMSLYFLTCPPLFNPMMFGLKMSKIQNVCQRLRSHVGSLPVGNQVM